MITVECKQIIFENKFCKLNYGQPIRWEGLFFYLKVNCNRFETIFQKIKGIMTLGGGVLNGDDYVLSKNKVSLYRITDLKLTNTLDTGAK